MPHIDNAYPYQMLDWYPHMRPKDRLIWDIFITQNPDAFLKVWYDVRVGDDDDIEKSCPAIIQADWHDLTMWQIDVVAEDEKKIYVIEIKPMANAKAVGQALAYAALYQEDHKPKKPVVPVVLTDVAIKTLLRCAQHCGVEVWAIS